MEGVLGFISLIGIFCFAISIRSKNKRGESANSSVTGLIISILLFIVLLNSPFENPVLNTIYKLIISPYFYLCIVIAIGAIIGIKRLRKEKISIINGLCDDYYYQVNNALKANSVKDFIAATDEASSVVDELRNHKDTKKIPKKLLNEVDDLFIHYETQLKQNYQWWLRNTIERDKKARINNIRNLYKNSKEHRESEYWSFVDYLNSIKNLFNEETKEYADEAINEVSRTMDVNLEQRVPYYISNNDDSIKERELSDDLESELKKIDIMEGHEFEHYCAELLKKNGFYNVKVTQASGDQGVDVLAEKDSIKYAIQCKCYSSDLGNTPIQEVYAGKTIYNCHVAAVMTNSHFTSSGKEAAKKTGVLLWDRDVLKHWIKKAYSINK